MLEDIKKDAMIRMNKSLESLRKELAKIRTGRAHPSLLDRITSYNVCYTKLLRRISNGPPPST